MKKIARLLLCLLLSLSLAVPVSASISGAAYPDTQEQTSAARAVPNKNNRKIKKILLIGNSYTWYHNLDQILENVCASAGVRAKVTSVTQGGANLAAYANKNSTLGRKVRQLLKKQDWDYVVLQDRHWYPILYPERTYKSVMHLQPLIEEAGAKTVLFMTWAPGNGHKEYKKLSNILSGRSEYQRLIRDVYETTARDADALVVPAGLALIKAEKEGIGVPLLRKDKSHPSYAGSYITACSIFYTLFPDASSNITYSGKLANRPQAARTLRRVALNTVNSYRQPAYDILL